MSVYDELSAEYRETSKFVAADRKRYWWILALLFVVAILMWGAHDAAEAIKGLSLVVVGAAAYIYRLLAEISARIALTNRLLLGIAEQSPARSAREVAELLAD